MIAVRKVNGIHVSVMYVLIYIFEMNYNCSKKSGGLLSSGGL